MADIRDQVNQARRAGYSEREIAEFVASQDSRVKEALSEGYSPDEIMSFIAPTPTAMEQVERGAGIVGRATGPTAVGTTAGALMGIPGGPPGVALGSVVGSLSVPVADAVIQAYNATVSPDQQITLPSQGIRAALERLGMGGVEPETRGERMLATASEALAGTGGQVAGGRGITGTLAPSGRAISQAPIAQLITAPTAAGGSQFVGEVTDSPIAALGTGLAIGGAAGIRPRQRGAAPTTEQMDTQIRQAFKAAEDANLTINIDSFKTNLFDINKKLRQEGWRPDNPELAGITRVVDALGQETGPKDLADLRRIRNEIKMAANPNDPNQYRLMKIVLNDFDTYLDNLPKNALYSPFQGKDAQAGLNAWKEARKLFSTEKKAEVFTDILKNLPVESTKFGQSGAENYLANELRKFVKNDKQMRLFTKTEQAEIRRAAEGGSLQNMLRYIGRIAPIGAIPQISALGLSYFEPTLLGAFGTGFAARKGAEQMRIGDVERIVDMIRTGQRQPTITQFMPTTVSRGLLSTELE
jgi:hypothetical protein